MAANKQPVHPGEILKTKFMKGLNLSQNRLAIALAVSAPRINALVNQRQGITLELALRLGRFFRNGPEFWLSLQREYELACADAALLSDIEQSVKPIDSALLNGVAA